MLNLDTHMLVHALTGELKASQGEFLRGAPWGISAIVLWELAKLVQLRRLDLDLDDGALVRALRSVHVWPIDLAVARTSSLLDFKPDPADEIIAATSVVHRAPLVTRDARIRRSKVVPLA